jgi:protein kinase-like protein
MKTSNDSDVARTPGLPDKIARYRIVDRVGKGAMGVVYSAVDEMMDRQVAVKVMMADLEGDPETRARFYREAQAAARLVHPNIITIFDIGEAEGRSFMVMELLRGCPLPDYLKLPDIGLERKLDLMIQLCEALSVAHAGGVFHRDIKPGNLFVQRDGLLKVLDFGIARLASSNMTSSGFIVGTPDYMAPEQARGKTVDCRSDIFSSGGVFYFILTGRKPFDAADLPAVLHKVEREDPLPLLESEAPVPLARVVAKTLAKEPERRYQRCQDVLTDLLRFKRYYENETRRMAESARALYQGIESLLVSTAAAERQLGIVAEARTSPVIDALSAHYPLFADRRAEAFSAFPFERSRIVAISGELAAEQDRLMALSAGTLTAQSSVEAGDAALSVGDARGALKLYERATQALPSCERAQVALTRAREEVGRQELCEEQVRALAHEAAAASQSASWNVVVSLCDRILGISAAESQATALRAKAMKAIENEEHQRVQALQRAIDQFERAPALATTAQVPANTDQTVDKSDWPPRTEETVSLTAVPASVARVVDRVGWLANGFWKKIRSNRDRS